MARRGRQVARSAWCIAAAALLAGCTSQAMEGDGGGGADGGAAPTADADLRPARTPLEDGLVVPEGARLAGSVFWSAQLTEDRADTWTALLVVDGDPFEVWDAMAAQVRALDGEPMLAGSRDACLWEPAAGNEDLGEEPHLRISGSPAFVVDGVRCNASAGSGIRYELSLQHRRDEPAVLEVIGRVDPEGKLGRFGPLAEATGYDPDAPAPTDEVVPAEASEALPEPSTLPEVEVGDAFGSDVNCFAYTDGEAGETDGRTRLPDGARLVGDSWQRGTVSVLAMEDPELVLADLRLQFEGDGSDQSADVSLHRVDLDDGRWVTQYLISISAGGGACTMTTSPDERYLRITRHAD